MTHPRCARCRRTATEVVDRAYLEEGETPDHFIRVNEGTYFEPTEMFLCDACYVDVGMPSSPTGWKASPDNLRALGIPT